MGGASSSRRHHALLTHSPARNRHDAFHAAGTTTADPDDARTLLAVQKPTVAPGDDYSAVVEFTTGPNLFEYDFNVVCYEQDVAVPTDSCGAVAAAVAAGDLSPLGSERGTLPRSRSEVAVTVTGLPQNADVDCFVKGWRWTDRLCQLLPVRRPDHHGGTNWNDTVCDEFRL